MQNALNCLEAAMNDKPMPTRLPSVDEMKDLMFALSGEDDLFAFIKAVEENPDLLKDRINSVNSNTIPRPLK